MLKPVQAPQTRTITPKPPPKGKAGKAFDRVTRFLHSVYVRLFYRSDSASLTSLFHREISPLTNATPQDIDAFLSGKPVGVQEDASLTSSIEGEEEFEEVIYEGSQITEDVGQSPQRVLEETGRHGILGTAGGVVQPWLENILLPKVGAGLKLVQSFSSQTLRGREEFQRVIKSEVQKALENPDSVDDILIPISVKSAHVNHIVQVLVHVDRSLQPPTFEVEFFDPLGRDPSEYTIDDKGTTLATVIENDLKTALTTHAEGYVVNVDTTVHTTQHQHDVHTCGIWGMWFAEQRLVEGVSPDKIDTTAPPSIEGFRAQAGKDLAKDYAAKFTAVFHRAHPPQTP